MHEAQINHWSVLLSIPRKGITVKRKAIITLLCVLSLCNLMLIFFHQSQFAVEDFTVTIEFMI